MGYNIYVGSSSYDFDAKSYTQINTVPDMSSIDYTVNTHIPGEYLVNLLHNVVIDSETSTTRQLKSGYSLNLADIPVDIGNNSANLNNHFSPSPGADPITIDDGYIVPFDTAHATVASVIPKVFGKQFPFTSGIDHNIRNIVPIDVLEKFSKFSFKDFGFLDVEKGVNMSLQGLVRSVYSNVNDSRVGGAYGHDIVHQLYHEYTDIDEYWDSHGRLLQLPEPVDLQFVLRLSLSHENIHMRSSPTHVTPFDQDNVFTKRVLILYNFVFDPSIVPIPITLATGTSWVLSNTYTSSVFMKPGGIVVPYESDAIFVKYSNNGNYYLAGTPASLSFRLFRSSTEIKLFSVRYTNAAVSNNGSRVVSVNEDTGKVLIKHNENGIFKVYYSKTYGHGCGRNISIDDSGTVVLISHHDDLYSDVFSGRVRTLRFDGQNWNDSIIFQGVISDTQYLGHGMAVSNDGVFIAYNKQKLDTTTSPHTVSRFVDIHKCITDGSFKKVGPSITGGPDFGNILKISKDGRRIAVWSSLDIKTFEYNGTDWFQVGQTLPPGTNVFISDSGGSLLIDNNLYTLN